MIPPKLAAALEALGQERKDRVTNALTGTVTAETIEFYLLQLGHPVSASTIRTYRRNLRRHQSVDEA